MAANKAIYETAMKRAHDYAWANQWERALKEYSRALAEFPEDNAAKRNMAQCLFRLRRWGEALEAYQSLVNADPTDLFALNRLAEVYLALGQPDKAIDAYNKLADAYLDQHQVHEAVRALRDLSRALPKDAEVHRRLLVLNQQIGDKQAQLAEHMALSALAFEANDLDQALQHAEAASSLDPENTEVKRWLYTVRRKIAETRGVSYLSPEADGTNKLATVIGTGLLGLQAQTEPEPPEVAALVQQAEEAQNAGNYRRALDLYDQAVRAGARRASVFYAAGLLNQQMGRNEAGIPYLERASQDPEFATSANYIMGQCYMALHNYPKAVWAFERALSLINFDQITANEADELIELYTATAEANLADNNIGRASSLYSNLVKIFKEHKWSHPKLSDLEQKADELYNRSIQSKLLGISKGSGFLNAANAPEDDRPAPATASAQPFEATRIMVEGAEVADHANEATNQLKPGTSIITDGADRPATTTEQQYQVPADIATQLMRPHGSSLRTITEYLRAADTSTGEELRPPDPTPDATHILPMTIAAELLQAAPPDIAEGVPVKGDHIYINLSASALRDVEKQTLAVQSLIAEGEAAVAEGKWDGAIDSCLAVIELEPGYLPIHLLLADIYLHQGRVEDAIAKLQAVMDTYIARSDPANAAEVCRRLAQLQPNNPTLQTRLGMLLLEAGKTEEAARALLAIPDSYFRAGDPQRALQEVEALRARLPDSSEVALATGTYHMALGNYSQALAELGRALTLDPANNTALVRLYTVLARTDDPTQWDALQSILERADRDKQSNRTFLEEIHSALVRKPEPSMYYGLAVVAERAGLSDIASDALDQGLEFLAMAATAELHRSWRLLELLMCCTRADLAMHARDTAVASQQYRRALDILKAHGVLDAQSAEVDEASPLHSPRPQYAFLRLPDPLQLYYGLAESYASENNWQGALEALDAIKARMPDDHSVYTRRADIYFRQGNLADALSELNDLLVIYQKANDNEKTLETLGHMARLAPNNIAVRRKLSDMYLKLGMTDHGLTELNTLAELQLKAGQLKDAYATYQRAADLYHGLGQHDKAIGIYERLVRLAPRDIEARHQLINLYILAGKLQEAIEAERTLAEYFIKEGQTDGAIAALHQLLALSPEDVPAHHMLAQQLISLGEYGQAARLYGRLMRLDPDDERVPIMHSEMLRMAKEAAEGSEGSDDPAPKTQGSKSDTSRPKLKRAFVQG
jgi:tetratricopeptide (TPR) repeat protein